jgi:hypothetical protein
MTKLFFYIVLLSATFPVLAQQSISEKINWPSNYEPSKSKFYVHNEVEINAEPEVVWGFLIDAAK